MKILHILTVAALAKAEPPVANFAIPSSQRFTSPSKLYDTSSEPILNYGTPSITSNYVTPIIPSTRYSIPSTSYGIPSTRYSIPSTGHSTPSTNYVIPSITYGTPLNKYGIPSPSYSIPTTNNGITSVIYRSPPFRGLDTYEKPESPLYAVNERIPSPYQNPKLNNNYLPPAYVHGYSEDSGYEGKPANYDFKYDVRAPDYGTEFGHEETQQGAVAQGRYYTLLPDGRRQIVEYTADANGYRPKITYEQINAAYQY